MRKWWFTLAASLLILAVPASVHADTNDFAITDFAADYTLTKGDPQGTLDVHERIQVDFTDYNHGILRALPQKYNGQNLHLSVGKILRDDTPEQFSTYTSNGNKVFKIGKATQTITGRHVYDISYSVRNVIRFTSDSNELDWNTNGTQWQQPFYRVTARLHVPTGLASQLKTTTCSTGYFGSSEHDCKVTAADDTTTFTTTRELRQGENMTLVAKFNVGSFEKPTAADWWREHIVTIVVTLGSALLSFWIGYRKWQRDGKDLKGRGTIIPEYTPPKGLRPAEADAVLHYKASTKAISATIIDLAIRKHLKIVESMNNGVLGIGKHKEYSFEKLESDTTDLNDYEQTLYTGLFRHGSSVKTDDLKNSYYKDVQAAQAQIDGRLVVDGYVPKGQFAKGWWLWILGIGELILAGALHSVVSLGFAAGGVSLLVFAMLMQRRTPKGVEAKDNLEGLKLYMNTAEKDRIAMLQSPNAPYAPQTDAPKRTIELFEKLLPYAIVLGVEKEWAKQFQDIYTTPPDWYSGNWTAFNAGYLVGSLGDSMSAMNTSFASPSSAGAGSGGGFSGGGGGGGGGGGW